MNFKSILKPENSVVAGIATMGLVYAIYELNVGNVSQAHHSDANHPALEGSRKKAGYTAFAAVAGLTLVTKDANVGILGFMSIVAMEVTYRHAIMIDSASGRVQPPSETAYIPAENVVPITQQAPQEAPAYAMGY